MARLILLVVAVLAACGGGGSEDEPDVHVPDSPCQVTPTGHSEACR